MTQETDLAAKQRRQEESQPMIGNQQPATAAELLGAIEAQRSRVDKLAQHLATVTSERDEWRTEAGTVKASMIEQDDANKRTLTAAQAERDVFKAIIEAVSLQSVDATSAESMRKDWVDKNEKLAAVTREIDEALQLCGGSEGCGPSNLKDLVAMFVESQSSLIATQSEIEQLKGELEGAHDPKSVGNIAWLAEQYLQRAERAEANLGSRLKDDDERVAK